MAGSWCVFVLLLAQNIFANQQDLHACDSCIQKGGKWCNSIENHCVIQVTDDACPNADYEELKVVPSFTEDGDLLKPMHAEETLHLRASKPSKMKLTYASATKRNVTTHITSRAPNNVTKININVEHSECNSTSCTVVISAKPSPDFCTYFDSVDIVVKVDGFTDVATIKYNVPCSCECSKDVEIKSPKCNHHGNYTCGICSCDPERSGHRCETDCAYRGRGDIDSDCLNSKHDELLECSGNGKCSCNECKCYGNREGSQYFDSEDKCSDICMQTILYPSCLLNGYGSVGDCATTEKANMTLVYRNETLATTEKDYMNRKVWVRCQENVDNCDYDYYAMKTEDGRFVVMINSNCNDVVVGAVATGAGAKVPLIVGILGLVAVIAAVGGILLWKHMNALPPLPMTDPQYANIDAEDCTGENPLYKPPTSSFKNPTYGKW